MGIIGKILIMSHDVFISFSFKDQEAANCIRSYLEINGIKCFICSDLPAGIGFDEALGQAIRESNALILILSPDADNSLSVRNETAIAKAHRKPIIPVRIVDFFPEKLEYLVATSLFFDAFPPPLENYLNKLADDTSKILNISTKSTSLTPSTQPRVSPASLPSMPPDPVNPPWPYIIKDQQWHPVKYEHLMDWVKDKINTVNKGKILSGKHFDYRRNTYTGGYEIKLKDGNDSHGYNPVISRRK